MINAATTGNPTLCFVTPSGLEPETPVLKARCSKPIELRSHIVVPGGFEPPRSESKSDELPLF
jgi:hypothetical protein